MPVEKPKLSLPHENFESLPLTSNQDHDDQPPTPNSPHALLRHLHQVAQRDPRFHQPTPSPLKRVALLFFVAFLFWLAFSMRRAILVEVLKEEESKVLHGDRYSEEYRFRPAASPAITETLKDGYILVHGAHPTALS